MRLNQSFLETLAAAVAEKIDTTDLERQVTENINIDEDDIVSAAVEHITDGIREEDVIEGAVEKLTDDIDQDDIVEKVAELLVDRITDDPSFMESIAEQVAERILGMLTEREPIQQREAIAIPETTPVSGAELTGGAMACLRCGGSVFMHRNGTCPSIPAVA